MNKQGNLEGLALSRVKPEEYQEVTDLLNAAYSVEIGQEGVAFKNSPRVGGGDVGGQSMEVLAERLLVVREEGQEEVVGVVGLSEDQEAGVADIGPLAVSVSRQRTGLGGRIMRWLEAEYDITSVGVVSCRTDILPFYERRGYRTFQQLPLEQVRRQSCSV